MDTPNPSQNIVGIRQSTIVTGPLPSPEILERYDDVLPGLAERIVQMAEKEQQHVHLVQQKQLNDEIGLNFQQIAYMKRAQWFAFMLSIILVAVSAYLAINGHELTASAIGGTTIVGIVSAYIIGNYKKNLSPTK